MLDRSIGSPTCQAVQEASPIMPSGAAARVVGLVDDVANFFESSDVFGVVSKREPDLALLQYGVDTAQVVGRRVRHRAETVERVTEVSQRLVISPTALSFFRGQCCVIDSLFGLVAPTKVKGQQFCNFVGAIGIQRFERVSDSAVM